MVDRFVLSGIGIEEVIMAAMVSNRRSTFGINCVRCKDELIAPERSEYRHGTHIRHLWYCWKMTNFYVQVLKLSR